ncbi:MAG: hypothetical protein M0R77_15080, partial [Gammaproteobacteria bacterium]|nr:hypothetical protein [Gammaproteobacteria bacterium]
MKFNTPGQAPIQSQTSPNTVTHEGAPSYKFDSIMELYMAVATTLMGEPKFYESGDERAKRIRRLISKAVQSGEIETVAKLAVYCRETLNLRSVPILSLYLWRRKFVIKRSPGTASAASLTGLFNVLTKFAKCSLLLS